MAFLAAGLGALGGATAGGGLSVGSLIGAAGTVLSGFAGLQAGKYQQKVAETNAKVAEDNAKLAVQSGAVKSSDNDAEVRAMIGQQEAMQGASGLNVNSGSSILTRRAARRLGRRDTLTIMNDALLERNNLMLDAANSRASGEMAARSGQASLLQGFLGGAGQVAGSLVGGSRSVGRKGSAGTLYDPWVSGTTTLRRKGGFV